MSQPIRQSSEQTMSPFFDTGLKAADPALYAAAQEELHRQQTQIELIASENIVSLAVLRAQGRHDEADKALAEFRKRHPEFKIPEATLGRVERR